jgi:hypothetical protein
MVEFSELVPVPVTLDLNTTIDKGVREEVKIAQKTFGNGKSTSILYATDMSPQDYILNSLEADDDPTHINTIFNENGDYIAEKYPKDILKTPLDELMRDIPKFLKIRNNLAHKSLNNSEYTGFNDHGQRHADYTSERGVAFLRRMGYDEAHLGSDALLKLVYVGLQNHDTGQMFARNGHWQISRKMAEHTFDLSNPVVRQIVLGMIGSHEGRIYTYLRDAWINYVQHAQELEERNKEFDTTSAIMIAKAIAILEDKVDNRIARMNKKVKSGKDFAQHEHSMFQALFRTTKLGYYEEDHDGTEKRQLIFETSFRNVLRGNDFSDDNNNRITYDPNADPELGSPIEVPEKYREASTEKADFYKSTTALFQLNSNRFIMAAISGLVIATRYKFADEFVVRVKDDNSDRAREFTFHRRCLQQDIERFRMEFPPYEPNPTPKEYPKRKPTKLKTIPEKGEIFKAEPVA